jgi:hypothetical protein
MGSCQQWSWGFAPTDLQKREVTGIPLIGAAFWLGSAERSVVWTPSLIFHIANQKHLAEPPFGHSNSLLQAASEVVAIRSGVFG